MTSISDAIFRQRPELHDPRAFADKPDLLPGKIPEPNVIDTAAAYGVLAGGYHVFPVEPEQLAGETRVKNEQWAVQSCRWLILLALASLAGLIGGSLARLGPKDGLHAASAVRVAKSSQPSQATHFASQPTLPARPAAKPLAAVTVASVAPPQPVVVSKPMTVAPPAAPAPAAQPAQDLKMVASAVKAETASTQLKPVQKAPLVVAAAKTALPVGAVASAPALTPPPAPTLHPDTEEVLYEADPVAPVAAAPDAPKNPQAVKNVSAPAPTAKAPAISDEGEAKESNASAKSGSFRVEGIFYDRVRPLALVGGNIVEVGSRVGSAKVVEIQTGCVTIEENGLRRTLIP